jgi:hypothetical protein
MSVSFNTLNPASPSSTGIDPPIWLTGSLSVFNKSNIPQNAFNPPPPTEPPYSALGVILNFPDAGLCATSVITLHIMLQNPAEQELILSIQIDGAAPYQATVAGLWPIITIELDGINLAPIDLITQSRTLGLLILPQTQDSFTYVELDGSIIP